MNSHDIVDLIKALVWPFLVLLSLITFERPLSDLIKTISTRATKLSLFKVEVDLQMLTQARPNLETTVEGLKKAIVTESGIMPITAGVIRSGEADYLLASLGASQDNEWLTSRLFLLAALLERSRVVRCIVFTGAAGKYVGSATPRDIRSDLGRLFPEYEKALLRAYGIAASQPLEEFRGGYLSENLITSISTAFLQPSHQPAAQPEFIVSLSQPPSPTRWVELDRSSGPPYGPKTWELADWVTSGSLKTILRDTLVTASISNVMARKADEESTRSILIKDGSFVAITNDSGAFEDLFDRNLILEKVARLAVAQTTNR